MLFSLEIGIPSTTIKIIISNNANQNPNPFCQNSTLNNIQTLNNVNIQTLNNIQHPTLDNMTTSSSSSPSASQPWLYFLTGALLPTIAYYFLLRQKKALQVDDDDDDDDDHESSEDEDSEDDSLFGIEATGPSSKWSINDAPYKVSNSCKALTATHMNL